MKLMAYADTAPEICDEGVALRLLTDMDLPVTLQTCRSGWRCRVEDGVGGVYVEAFAPPDNPLGAVVQAVELLGEWSLQNPNHIIR